MEPYEHENNLRKILRLRQGSKDILNNRENSKLEFKESFNLGNRAKYARTMAAFANNIGGYIIFGIEPSPHRLKGINVRKFSETDPAKLTQFLNDHLSPELEWDMSIFSIYGKELGYIYTEESVDKPVICLRSNSRILTEGAVYYRYRGQSAIIKYPELRDIIDDRLAKERKAWMQHLETIGKVGPTNVGVLDTVHGKLFGAGPPFLIDESLLRDLKFIRRGRFSETEGAPTLRLIGEIQPICGTKKEKAVHVGIHADDLITAFLAQRPLTEGEARSYLRETAYQTTPFLPIHYYISLGHLSQIDAIKLVESQVSPFPATRNRVLKRITREETVRPIGVVDSPLPSISHPSKPNFLAALKSAKTAREKRSLLVDILRRAPTIVLQSISGIPLGKLCEAITHLRNKELSKYQTDLLEILLNVFVDHFSTMQGNEKTAFRKAVAYCDEQLSCS